MPRSLKIPESLFSVLSKSERESLATLPAECIGSEPLISKALYALGFGLPEECVRGAYQLSVNFGQELTLKHLVLLPDKTYRWIIRGFRMQLHHHGPRDGDELRAHVFHPAVKTGFAYRPVAPKTWAEDFVHAALVRRPFSSLLDAFPRGLIPDDSALLTLLDAPSVDARSSLVIEHEFLESGFPWGPFISYEYTAIPSRIVQPSISKSEFQSLSSIEQRITACWFTRHGDGHVRERFLRELPNFDSPWVIAYVVALSGEYVIEILDYIWEQRALCDFAILGKFLSNNWRFHSHICSRIISYWNCYYRTDFPRFENYVGGRLTAFFSESMDAYIRECESQALQLMKGEES